MSVLNRFLEETEVKWETIDNLFHVKNGYTPSKSSQEYWNNGTIPWFRMEDIRKNGRVLSDSKQHVSESAVKGQLIPENSLLMSTTATIGEHALILIPYLTNQQITNFSLKSSFVDKVNIKYLFYCFFDFGKWCIENANKNGGLSIIGTNKLKEYTIPIPSLKVQIEIVRILDKFTELTAELTTELTAELMARKQQYTFYREQLFSFDEGTVEWMSLGDERIGRFIRGGGLQKKDFTETGVGCIHYGQIYTYYGTYTDKTKSFVSTEFAKKARMAKHGDLVIATTSENDEDVCKAVAWLGDEEIAISSDACFYTHSLNPKYVAYFFQTEYFQKQKRPFITGTKVRRVNADDLAKIKIPVPSPEEQERIVTILDKFDILTTSISEGLSKEIKLRKKQYEHYRDLLLTFSKNNIES